MNRVHGMVMAGGVGSRMAASQATVPKALLPVGGVPLLERAIRELIRFGLKDISVVVPDHTPEIGVFAESLRDQLDVLGVRFQVFVETAPRGNMGAASLLAGQCEHALLLFADNLSNMNLGALVAAHQCSDADITLATHTHHTQIPFGELAVQDGLVTAYLEKPTVKTTVCSGTYVLSNAALNAIPETGRVRADQLVSARIAAGSRVVAWPHNALWFDVNDRHIARRASAALAELEAHSAA